MQPWRKPPLPPGRGRDRTAAAEGGPATGEDNAEEKDGVRVSDGMRRIQDGGGGDWRGGTKSGHNWILHRRSEDDVPVQRVSWPATEPWSTVLVWSIFGNGQSYLYAIMKD
jgi:hypothetical protein